MTSVILQTCDLRFRLEMRKLLKMTKTEKNDTHV
jgi:hypothetical protein